MGEGKMEYNVSALSRVESDKLESMGLKAYKEYVIALFKSGQATEEQYEAMGEAVCIMSESYEGYVVAEIDRAVIKMNGEVKM